MEIEEQTIYSIKGLSKEELLFFFEVVEKMQLSEDSTPISFELSQRFKRFQKQLLGDFKDKPEAKEAIEAQEVLTCIGCETNIAVTNQECPVEDATLPLCPTCAIHRKHLADEINVKQNNSTTSR